MKFNKKGFTLVELLAVIVILAIIAVIAVPSILAIIEGARKDSFRADVRSAFKAAELEYVRTAMTGDGGEQTYYVATDLDLDNNNFKSGTLVVTLSGDDTVVSIGSTLVGKTYKTALSITYIDDINGETAVIEKP